MFLQKTKVYSYKCSKCKFVFYTVDYIPSKHYCSQCGKLQNNQDNVATVGCKKKSYTKSQAMTWLAKAY